MLQSGDRKDDFIVRHRVLLCKTITPRGSLTCCHSYWVIVLFLGHGVCQKNKTLDYTQVMHSTYTIYQDMRHGDPCEPVQKGQ